MRQPKNWIVFLIVLPALMACQPARTEPAPTVTYTPLPPTLVRPTPTQGEVTPTDDTGDDTIVATPSGPTPTPLYSVNTLEGFRQLLTYGIDTKNYQYLLYAMTSPFTIADENGGGQPIKSRDAIARIESDLLPKTITVHYDFEKDLTPLLGGKTPQQMFPADANVVNAFYSSGWGKDGKGAAILFITQSRGLTYRWYAVMFAPQGFK